MDLINAKNKLRQIPTARYLITLTLSFLLGACLVSLSIKQLLFLIIGTITLTTCLFSIRYGIYLLILITTIPTSGGQGLQYVTGIEIASKNIKIIEIIYIAVILSWFIQLAFRKINLPEFGKNLPFYLFFIYLIFSTSMDWLLHGNLQDTFLGSIHLFYYGIYFVVVSVIKDLKEVKAVCNIIIIGSVSYSIIIISMYVWPSNPLWQFTIWSEMTRASFGGGIILPFGMALLFTRFFISPIGRERIYCVLAIMPILFALIMGLWRAGWIVFIMFLFMFFISLKHKRELSVKTTIKACVASLFILVVIFMSFNMIVGPRGSISMDLLINRIKTFENVQTDPSIVWRAKAMGDDVQKIIKNPVLGEGYSRYYYSQHHGGVVFFDNTHIPFLRKMGLVGYAFFLWIFLRFWKRVFFIFRYSKDRVSKEYSIALVSLFPGIIFLTFVSAFLIAYDFIFVFATLVALAEITACKQGIS